MTGTATTLDGLVVVDKPAGLTSHDVVARIRRLAGTRKVGHAGTLDPMATGVLVVGLGRATRLLGHLALTEKAYDATIRLGEATTTDDADGETVSRADASEVSDEAVGQAVAAFVGDILQVPSTVSAIKVQGRRAYARARAGEAVELTARRVLVSGFDVLTIDRSADTVDVGVRVHCSSGTYVRALARDLGATLGVGGHLIALRRTRVGPFDLDRSVTLDELAHRWCMVPIADAARQAFPSRDLDDDQAAFVRNGRPLPGLDLDATGPVAVFAPEGELLALYEQADADARAVAVLAPG
ncbi:MAG: tRNA pseudouridine(55) synthase TruB [Nocardioidaceae bacterium]